MIVNRFLFWILIVSFIEINQAKALEFSFGETEAAPSPPASVLVPSSSTGNYSLSWSSVGEANYYEWRESINGSWSSSWTNTNNIAVNFNNKPNASYQYQVRACNYLASPKCGNPNSSNIVVVSTIIKPGAPSFINISDGASSNDGTYIVSWDASSNNPTSYEYRELANGSWGSWISNGNAHSKSIAGKGNGTYAYQARGCNSAGCGSARSSSNVVVSIPQGNINWQNTGGSVPDDPSWSGDTPALTGNTNVGALEGSGGVSGGAATYNIPIVIPPGRAGMQPSVSLNYSSRSGNGVAGVGWSLSAGSSIHRCSATAAQDKYGKGVTYSSSDKLCLDGQRLIRVGGSAYGQSGAVYRTELDSFARITQNNGDINSSNPWFKVEHKDGRVSIYGAWTSNLVKAGGRNEVSSWNIGRVSDQSGNNIWYDYYDFGNGEVLLKSISYTGFGSSVGDRHVRMVYENRPDLSNAYLAGGLTVSSKRLNSIVTQSQSQSIREYRLRYGGQSLNSKRSLLKGIKECSLLGPIVCLPETIFNWEDKQASFALKLYSGAGVSLKPTFDFDGDAVKEVIMSEEVISQTEHGLDVHYTEHSLVSYSSNGDLKWEKAIDNTSGVFSLLRQTSNSADINNNGIQDVLSSRKIDSTNDREYIIKELDNNGVGAFSKTIKNTGIIRVTSPSGIDFNNSPGGFFSGIGWQGYQDIDADGKQDIVYADFIPYNQNDAHTKTIVKVHYNTSRENQVSFAPTPVILASYLNKGTKGPIQNPQAKYLYRLKGMQDLDGNGLSDLMLWNSYCGNSRSSQADVAFNINGTYVNKNFLSMGIYASNLPHETYHIWTDINGDGLSDYLFIPNRTSAAPKTWHYQLNKGYTINQGATFAPVVNTGSSVGMVPTDFNGSERLMKDECGNDLEIYTPKFAQILQVADYDNDGINELLAPSSEVPVTRACVISEEFITPEPGRAPTGDTPEASPALLYEYCAYQSGASGELYASGLGRRDRSIYNFKAHKFTLNSAGNFTLQEINGSSHFVRANERQGSYQDLDGDGLTDVLLNTYNSNKTSDWIRWRWDEALPAGVQADKTYIQKANYEGSESYLNVPDTIKSSINGLGVNYQWSYSPISHNANRSSEHMKLYNVPNVSDPKRYIDDKYFYFTSSMYVVDKLKQSDGLGGLNESQYSYREAIYNNQGRGFQGFRSIVVDDLSDTDPAKHIRSVSDFHQKFPLAGKLEKTRTCLLTNSGEDCSSNVITEGKYTWSLWRNGVKKQTVDNAAEDFSAQVYDGQTSVNRYWVSPYNQFSYDYLTKSGHNQAMTVGGWIHHTYQNFVFNSNGCQTYARKFQHEPSNVNRTETVTSSYYHTANTSSWWLCKPNYSLTMTKAVSGRGSDYAGVQSETDITKEIKTTYVFDNSHRKPKQITTTAVQGQGTADGLNSIVNTVYNSYGLPAAVVSDGEHYTGADMADRNVSTTYTADGYFVNSVTNSKGHVTTTEVNPIHGQATKVIDPNGQVTAMTYDAFGRVHSTKLPGEPTQYTAYSWCSGINGGTLGCIQSTGQKSKYRVTQRAVGAPDTLTYFDAFNRSVRTQTRNFKNTSYYYNDTRYDKKGQVVWTRKLDGGVTTWQYTYYDSYDVLGRLTKKRTPQSDGGHLPTTYQYDGFVTNINAGGLEMARKYNGLGQLVWTRDAAGNYTRYAYDGTGNPITLQDANGNPIYAKYNALGQKEYVDDPNMGKKFFWYNTFGEVEKEVDANGDELTYSYDTLGRLYRRWTNAQVSGDWRWDYPTVYGGRKGKLFWHQNVMSGTDRHIQYYYYATTTSGKDYLSHTRYHTIDGTQNLHDYVYNYVDNNYGRPKGMKYGTTGLTLAYDYNPQGYMSKVKNANGGYVYQEIKDLDNHGKVTSQLMGHGVMTQTASYDPATAQMTMIKSQKTSGATRLHELTYSYDDFSNLNMQVMIASNGVSNSEDYQYDSLHRLIQSDRTLNTSGQYDPITYNYDAVGNFKKKSDFATAFYYGNADKSAGQNAGPNAVRAISKTANGSGPYYYYHYDNNGNMKSGDGKTITYNEFNKPLTIKKGNITSSFSYGADLMRYKQVKIGAAGGTITTYYIDKLLEKEVQGSTTKYKHYIGDVAIQTKKNSTWDLSFIHRDRLGSVVTVTDQNGLLKEHRSYDPFGKPRKGDFVEPSQNTFTSITGLTQMNRTTERGFTDHEHLDDHELIHMNGRAYDYNLGRFLSVDPFVQAPGNSQSMNPYSYIMNNPMAGTDPSGYLKVCDTFVICSREQVADENYNKEIKIYGAANNGVERKQKTSGNNKSSSGSSQSPEKIKSKNDEETSGGKFVNGLIKNYKKRSASTEPGRREGRITDKALRKVITQEIRQATKDFIGKDLGSNADNIVKLLDMRLYDISQKHNIEIGAIISYLDESAGSLQIQDGDIYTSFESDRVNAPRRTNYSDHARWHTHPGRNLYNDFSTSDIRTALGGGKLNSYISATNGSIYKFNAGAYRQHIKDNLMNEYGIQIQPQFKQFRQSVIANHGEPFVSEVQ